MLVKKDKMSTGLVGNFQNLGRRKYADYSAIPL
jgi:hypothetical protein